MRSYFSGKTVLVTGGTGSLGRAVVNGLISRGVGKVCVLSRDELKHVAMKREYAGNKKIRYLIGDVRNDDRLEIAFKDVHIVVHAAAMKHVDLSEYNPWECTSTNVIGTQNVIDAAINAGVRKVLFISSDKAVNPVNIYGASKLMGERLVLGAEAYAGKSGPKFSIVRFGNFMYSSGSVLELWRKLYQMGQQPLPITNRNMTRFWVQLREASDHVLHALLQMNGGEIFIPKMIHLELTRMARGEFPKCEFIDIPERPGEKLHEEMLLESEAVRALHESDCYVIHRERKRGTNSEQMVREFKKLKYIL
jgi:UDP-N-acetylglucosamine 4,6-dehydratase